MLAKFDISPRCHRKLIFESCELNSPFTLRPSLTLRLPPHIPPPSQVEPSQVLQKHRTIKVDEG